MNFKNLNHCSQEESKRGIKFGSYSSSSKFQCSDSEKLITYAMRNFYEVLGVRCDASRCTIQKAYKTLNHSYESYKFNFRTMEINAKKIELQKEIEEAYITLGDPKRRACYDTCLICKSLKIGPSPNRHKIHVHLLATPVTHLKHRCPNCLVYVRDFKTHFRAGCNFKFDSEKSTLLTEERKKYIRRDGINFIAGYEEGFKKGCKASAFHSHYWPSKKLLASLAPRQSGPTRCTPPKSHIIVTEEPETILGI